ncbi:hypothetical protein P9E34_14200 [Schinkia azotoformans]|uniref:hypothetical protein n=1 Tax=Schinkia azotoformans TaxID=1454 RepID=UPI002DBF089D|nr:hypothetical protein [Schinkia azotoformans]MEC1725866.1 hypothetical protein [Schinkia azotoformans]
MKVVKGNQVVHVPEDIAFKIQVGDEVIDHESFKKQKMKISLTNDYETVWFVQDDYEVDSL